MQTVILNVDGMICSGCVESITRLLKAVDGVVSAAVSLENWNATVVFDETRTTPDVLREAVEDGGYDVSLA